MRQMIWGALGAALVGERLWKQALVMRFFQRPIPPALTEPELVSLLLPVVSGDPTMALVLERNLRCASRYRREYLLLGDTNDPECERVCREVAARHPAQTVRYLAFAPPPQGHNPKMHKLVAALPEARGDVICVLDDDTELPDHGLEACLPYLDQPGVGLAFGLPYYVSFDNLWSGMTAAFVNSNSLLTYIPYTALTEPFTINGMFYAIKRTQLDAVGGLAGLETQLADDFAVAHRFRQHGLRLAQTPLRHAIRTQVKGPAHYFNLIRRWFVAPRESILRYVGPRDQAITYSIGMLPALAPLGILATAAAQRKASFWAFALGYFGLNCGIFAFNNARYLRHATPWRKAWLAPVMLAVFPFQLLFALLAPQRVNWRGNVMQIERGGTFRYLHRRSAEVK